MCNARRAFGNGVGFVVGWSDWLNQAAAIAYAALTAAVFIATLWPASAEWPRAIAITVIGSFTVLHWAGLRIGSTLTRIISLAIGLMMLVLVVACFIAALGRGIGRAAAGYVRRRTAPAVIRHAGCRRDRPSCRVRDL